MANTITIPSNDVMIVGAVNRYAKASGQTVLNAGQKFACVTLKLAPAVTSADYAALAAAINAITGIQGVDLLVDGQVGDPIPAGHGARILIDAALNYYSA